MRCARLDRHTDDLVVGLALRAGKVLGMVAAHSFNIPGIPNERETSLNTDFGWVVLASISAKGIFQFRAGGSIRQCVQNGQFFRSLAQHTSHRVQRAGQSDNTATTRMNNNAAAAISMIPNCGGSLVMNQFTISPACAVQRTC